MYVLCQIVLDSIFTPKGYLEMIAFMNKYQNAVEYIMVRWLGFKLKTTIKNVVMISSLR